MPKSLYAEVTGAFKKSFNHTQGKMWRNYQGPDRKELVFVFKADPALLAPEIWLEQVKDEKQYAKLPLMNGEARAWVRPGPYMFAWRANTTKPSAKYVIKVTDPESARWDPGELTSAPDTRIDNSYSTIQVG
jgi:hypothetical protein